MALWHEIENSVGKWIENADAKMHEWGMPDWYIGYNSNNGWDINVQPNKNPIEQTQIKPQKPQAYQANAAKTASSIKQGGMTKDEVQEFNMKHPNETAIRGSE